MFFKGLTSRLRMAATAGAAAFSGAFTGASETGTRTSTSGMPIDSRREVGYYTRIQLMKKSRWLCNNLGLVRRFINGTARYTVGRGVSHIPATKDMVFNDAAESYFNEWASNELMCDVRGKRTFWRQQTAVMRSMFRDGDSFVIKAPLKDQILSGGAVVPGMPQLQWIESHVVASKGLLSTQMDVDPDGYREGILATPVGSVLSYKVLQDRDPNSFDLSESRIVPASSMMHIYDDERASQLRGLPWLYHGMNSALDILDLTSMEKVAVKLHSAMAASITKKGGDAGRGGFTGDLTKSRGKTANNKNKVLAYENFAGGAGILQLDLDEKFELFTSNRPSVTFSGFIDFLVRDIAWGFGVSPEFIWSVSGLGGPNSRFILEDAKWFFEELQDLLVDLFCRKVYVWVIARGIERGELPECTDPQWWICDWIGPSKITIDQGRDGQLELDRLNAACATWDDYWAARGKSGKKMVRKRIDEIADAMAYAKEKGVPFEFVVPLKPGTPGQQLDDSLSKNKKSEDDNDEE